MYQITSNHYLCESDVIITGVHRNRGRLLVESEFLTAKSLSHGVFKYARKTIDTSTGVTYSFWQATKIITQKSSLKTRFLFNPTIIKVRGLLLTEALPVDLNH